LFMPMGVVRRMLGNDKLQLRRRPTDSYWKELQTGDEAGRYERQF
jgi:hypothetical protein